MKSILPFSLVLVLAVWDIFLAFRDKSELLGGFRGDKIRRTLNASFHQPTSRLAGHLYFQLRDSVLFTHYAQWFKESLGFSLRLLPPEGASDGVEDLHGAPFCGLMRGTASLTALCEAAQSGLQRRVARQRGVVQKHCHAGLVEIAVPVMVDRRHEATLIAGRIRDYDPRGEELNTGWSERFHGYGSEVEVERFKAAWLEHPLLTPSQVRAAVHLLEFFAKHLAREVLEAVESPAEKNSPLVKRCKALISSRLPEVKSVAGVADALHVSRRHLNRVWMEATRMTVRDYLALVRVEKAKELLAAGGQPISDIAAETGFGSYSEFHRVFRKLTGLSAKAWRTARYRRD